VDTWLSDFIEFEVNGTNVVQRTMALHEIVVGFDVFKVLSCMSQSQFASVDSVTGRKGGCGHVFGINGAITPALMEIGALWPHQVDGPNWALTKHRLSERRYNRFRHRL
jgi:hypothetical protein